MKNDNRKIIKIAVIVFTISISIYILYFSYRFIKGNLGIPDIYTFIDNEDSILLDNLINIEDFESEWKLSSIIIDQSEVSADKRFISSARISIIGRYKKENFELIQTVKSYPEDYDIDSYFSEVVDITSPSNNYIFQELYSSTLSSKYKMNIFCYYKMSLNDNNKIGTNCNLFQYNSNIFKELTIAFDNEIGKEQVVQLAEFLVLIMNK